MGCGTSAATAEEITVDDTAQRTQSEYLFKLLLVGDSQVGKSSLQLRYTSDTFTECYTSTTSVDFRMRKLEVDGRKLKLRIWDTPSPEHLSTITAAYYRNTQGVLLLYDVTNQESFNSIKRWSCDIDQHANENVVKLLVGNKCDETAQKVVDYKTAEEYAAELGIPFVETSAKDGTNVEQAFMTLVTKVLNSIDLQTDNKPNDVQITL